MQSSSSTGRSRTRRILSPGRSGIARQFVFNVDSDKIVEKGLAQVLLGDVIANTRSGIPLLGNDDLADHSVLFMGNTGVKITSRHSKRVAPTLTRRYEAGIERFGIRREQNVTFVLNDVRVRSYVVDHLPRIPELHGRSDLYGDLFGNVSRGFVGHGDHNRISGSRCWRDQAGKHQYRAGHENQRRQHRHRR